MNRSLDSLRAYVRDNRTHHHAPQPGLWVVGSGKGGVGTSVISALIAAAGHVAGHRTLLVDGDEASGGLDLLLGLTPDRGIGLLRDPNVSPEQLVLPLGQGFDLLPGGGGVEDGLLAVTTGERRYLFGRLRDLFAQYGLVVIDGGSRLDSVGAACQTGAERLFVVTTPDRVASGVSYALLKATSQRFPGLRMGLMVNHASRILGRNVAEVVRDAAGRFLDLETTYLGSVPTDGRLQQLVMGGERWLLASGTAALPATRAVAGIVKNLLPTYGDESDVIPLAANR